jgi:ribosome-binding protein aMBF1 (putative translation factor)
MEHEGAPARPDATGELHETSEVPETRKSSEICETRETDEITETSEPSEQLPLLPGFREMALRRMAAQRRRLVTDLAAERQAARLSQTEVAARMGTSQSAVARLESGEADARASTLERYAAAIGCQITWQLQGSGPTARREDTSGDGYASS